MKVGGGNIGAAAQQNQAGQTDTTADLEDALARHREGGHRLGQEQAGRPH